MYLISIQYNTLTEVFFFTLAIQQNIFSYFLSDLLAAVSVSRFKVRLVEVSTRFPSSVKMY